MVTISGRTEIEALHPIHLKHFADQLFHRTSIRWYVHHCVFLMNIFDYFEHTCKISRLFDTGSSCILLIDNDLVFCKQLNHSLDCINLGEVTIAPRNNSCLVGDGSSCCNIKITILLSQKVYPGNEYLLLIILEPSFFCSFSVTHQ